MTAAPIDITAATRCVAAHGLPSPPPAPSAPLDEPGWAALLGDVRQHRLEGLLAASASAGALPVTGPQREEVDRAHATAMARALDIEAAAIRSARALAAAGVPTRLLKGLATAHLDYPDPSWRCFGDADLLVPAGEFNSAVRALEAIGGVRDLPERRPGFDARFGKDATVVVPGSVEIDVHRTLVLGAFGLRLPLEDLWGAEQRLALGGLDLSALAPIHRLLHAAIAAVLGDRVGRLAPLRDLSQILQRDDIAPDDVVATAEAWQVEAPLSVAIRSAGDVFGPAAMGGLDAWANRRPPSPRDVRLLRRYERFGGTNTRALLSGHAALPWRLRPSYFLGLVAPTRAYRRARTDRHRPNEWTRGLRELLQGRHDQSAGTLRRPWQTRRR